MSTPMTRSPIPAPGADVRPTARQAVVAVLGGLVLAAGTCAGFWSTFQVRGGESPANVAFIIGFGVGLLVFGVGCVLVLVRQVRIAVRRKETVDAARGQAASSSAYAPERKPAATVGAGAAADAAPAGNAAARGASAGGTSSPPSAWQALVIAVSLFLAALGSCFGLVLFDGGVPGLAAIALAMAALCGAGACAFALLACVRYLRQR